MNKGNNEVIITSDELFDDDKFVLDDGDKERIEKNISFLEENNIPCIKHMRTIPINSTTKIKSEEEILNKLIINYTLSLLATFSLNDENKLIGLAFNKIDSKFGVRRLLSNEDMLLIDDILDNKLSKNQLVNISLLIEDVAIYLWVLGFMNKPFSSKQTNINDINKFIFKSKNYLDLLYKCNIKSKSEILEYADLIARYQYACRKYRMDGINQDRLNERIVERQRMALDYVVSYSLDNFKKEKLKITVEKGNLYFSFNIPSNLNFVKVDGEKELLALNGNNNHTKISFSDMGVYNQYEFDIKAREILRAYSSNGFDIIHDCEFENTNVSEKIKHIVLEKNSNAFSSYLIYISNHIVKIDSIIDNNIDYDDYDLLTNSTCFNIDKEILFSICEEKKEEEIKPVKEIKINNIYDYSDIICNYDNINKIIEFSNMIFNKFDNLLLKSNGSLKKLYPYGLDIIIINSEYNKFMLKSYDDYLLAYKEGLINKISSLSIEINLNYKKDDIEYNNLFKIIIKPYNIKFYRTASHDETAMNQIELSFIKILDKLPKEESIFI